MSADEIEAHVEALWYGVGDDIEAFRAYLTNILATARADAWDEGFDEGERDVFEHERTSYDTTCIPNPYRALDADETSGQP